MTILEHDVFLEIESIGNMKLNRNKIHILVFTKT